MEQCGVRDAALKLQAWFAVGESQPQQTPDAGDRRKSGPERLALKLADEDRADCRGSRDQSDLAPFHRFQRAVSMEVGQRVVLVCTIWSTHNQMAIESGAWGAIRETANTIRVEWQLPFYRRPLSDRFRPDEYPNHFEEVSEMNSFAL